MQEWPPWVTTQRGIVGERWNQLVQRMLEWLERPAPPSSERITEQLRRIAGQTAGQTAGQEVAAILFYGSCLFAETQTTSSFPDFYVLVDRLYRYHGSRWHVWLNRVLPPNVYYGTSSRREGSLPLRYKYCVMSVDQFVQETSSRAHDIHHLGRFSKRFALVFARDAQTRRLIVESALSSMLTLVPHSLALLPARFSLEEFLYQQLSLSYLGERRVSEPAKVRALFAAARDFYLELYPRVLALYAMRYGTPQQTDESAYVQSAASPWQRQETERFLARSRRRGMLRWPKYMLTVDNWLQYILDKLERHQGIKVELSARQRRHPVLFGWPIYFELRRKGIVK